MVQLLPITQAKQKLLELARRNEEFGESFVFLKEGRPISALLPFAEYESILETLDILEDEPDILKKLKAAEKEIAKGRYVVWKKPRTRKVR